MTTVEIKSGYGLDLETERRMLAAARRVADELPVRVRTTFLGAHTVPEEYRGRPDAYVDLVCDDMVPAVAAAGLADAVDAFCERIAFSAEQVTRVFDAARRHGLPVKLHADQLSDGGGAALAASFDALSADHLEHTPPSGVRALAAAGTVAVLLPGATHTLGDRARPPVAALRAAGVPMAVSTDANPGTSPLLSLRLAANLACTLLGLTPAGGARRSDPQRRPGAGACGHGRGSGGGCRRRRGGVGRRAAGRARLLDRWTAGPHRDRGRRGRPLRMIRRSPSASIWT